jgi:hypothetical protein
MACKTEFPGYFEAVFEHGGDPNLIRKGTIPGDTPLFSVISGAGPKKKEHVRFLIEKGADLSHMNGAWATPAMEAVSCTQYGIALLLLDAGADCKVYVPKSNTRLVHIVAGERRREQLWTPEQKADYDKLVNWLEAHGESIEQAKADNKRWQSWMTTPHEFRLKMDAEIAVREVREAREKKAAKKPEQKP